MRLRRTAVISSLAIALFASWLFWNRPQRVDMAAYVPADSLAYVEVSDLSALADGISGTTAWRALSGPSNSSFGLGGSPWLTRLTQWTGLGPAEGVVLARSQFAITLLEFDTRDAGTALQVNLLAALVIETHTSQFRMRPVLERRIEEFARRKYGQPRLEHKDIDGVDFAEWLSPDGSRRVVSAFVGTVAYIGNDEAPVRACIAVRNGTRQSLSANKFFNDERDGVQGRRTPVFAFIPPSGLKAFLIATAPYYLGPAANTTNLPGIVASTAAKLVVGVTWAPRFVDGQIEDRVNMSITPGVAQQLRPGLVPEKPPAFHSADLMPRTAHSFTQYNLRDSATAWRDLNTSISSHVDFLLAVEAPKFLSLALKSYGIDDPNAFLSAVGSELTTVRLDAGSTRPLLMVEVLDVQALRRIVRDHLGAGSTTERIGEAEMSVSSDPERGAASFVDNALIMGAAEDVRRCLQARTRADRMATSDSFQRARGLVNVTPPALPMMMTFTSDADAARSFVMLFSADHAPALSPTVAVLNEAAAHLPARVGVTQLSESGFAYTSRSSFGLLGSVAVLLASGDSQ